MAARTSSPRTANCTSTIRKVREAAIKALTYPTTAYKEGFVPPGAINWNDADDNNAFHAKQIVMDLDGTISTEVAIIKNKQDYDDIVTMGLPLSNDGKPVPSQAGNVCGLIPKGAKNVAVGQGISEISDPAEGLQRVSEDRARPQSAGMPSIVKDDPWWLDATRTGWPMSKQGLLGPTVPQFWVYNPAYAQVQNEHVWSVGWTDIMQGRNDAASGGGEGVQAGRGDLRQIPDRTAPLSGLRRSCPF